MLPPTPRSHTGGTSIVIGTVKGVVEPVHAEKKAPGTSSSRLPFRPNADGYLPFLDVPVEEER